MEDNILGIGSYFVQMQTPSGTRVAVSRKDYERINFLKDVYGSVEKLPATECIPVTPIMMIADVAVVSPVRSTMTAARTLIPVRLQ